MKSFYDPFEDFGPQAFVHTLSTYPYDEKLHYAPRLHVRAYHMSSGKKPHHRVYASELIDMKIPKAWKLADTKKYIAERETELYTTLQEGLDDEFDIVIEPLTYDGVFPYLGRDLPIRALQGDGSPRIADDVVYLPAGLSDKELRATALDLLIGKAYPLMLPKLQHFSKMMGLPFSALEIDDGRRSFGWFNDIYKYIVLSRRLLMLSESVIDFLIVHELAHNASVDHGKQHDAVMGNTLPKFETFDEAFNKGVSDLIERGWV